MSKQNLDSAINKIENQLNELRLMPNVDLVEELGKLSVKELRVIVWGNKKESNEACERFIKQLETNKI